MLKPILLLSFVVFIAGCTQIPDFGDIEIDVNPVVTDVGPRNIIVVNNINTIPTSPVLPDDNVDFSFIIENVDEDNTVSGLSVDLFDAGGFYNTNGNLCNVAGCPPIKTPNSQIPPGGQIPVDYIIKSPTEADILGLSTDYELRFSVEYDYTAKSTHRPVIVNLAEIKALQRAGQKVSVDAPTSVGNGPVKINLGLKTREFILTDNQATFEVVVEHLGADRIKNNKINAKQLEITIVGLGDCNTVVDQTKDTNNRFTKLIGLIPHPTQPSQNNCVLTNDEEIEILRDGKSTPKLFTLQKDVAKTGNSNTAPTKSIEIRATANYKYSITDSVKITVNPANV
jgi:hypothetical protein